MLSIPIPFFKIGTANVVTLLVLIQYGTRETLTVVVVRVVLGSLLMGTLFQPNFVFALAGGLSSAFVMGVALEYGHRFLGLIGISILGAFTKNATQLLVACLIWVHQMRLLSLLPLFFLISVIAGTWVGLLTSLLLKKLYVPVFLDEKPRS
jgi:heptaprenyl diphosphate synthase